jgi:hypothetical protein
MAQVVEIMGISFCGSTLACHVLGSAIPGAVGIGEAHWLVDEAASLKASGMAWQGCFACRPSPCPVLDPLRGHLSNENLYDKLAEALGANPLVVSDKNLIYCHRFIRPRHSPIGVVLFKRPESQEASNDRHGRNMGISAMNAYVDEYTKLLMWGGKKCHRLVSMKYEDLAADPNGVSARLARAVGLPEPTGPVVFPPQGDYHFVGGNESTIGGERYASQSIRPDDRWKHELTEKQKKAIREDKNVQSVYAELLSRAV